MTLYCKSKTFCQSRHHHGLAVLSLILVFSVFCLGLAYLIQTNSLVSKSYQIRQQKEHLKELETFNHDLEIGVAQWRSPINLEELIKPLGMIEVKQATYLEGEKAMAIKK